MLEIRFKRRATGGASGAPSSLRTAEPAYNMADGKLYIGYGDTGSGTATSIKVFGKDDFIANVPAGGATGHILSKNSNADGDWSWVEPPEGALYTASGDGIKLTGTVFSLDYGEIAAGIELDDYATVTALNEKADANHEHDASDITSGVLDIARIPVLPGNQTITSSGGLGDLTGPQQDGIEEGTIVTTTDGSRWVYTGSGSKTSETSYIELADITPDWSTITSKPNFADVATSGAYGDLSGRPSLSAVATSGSYNDLSNLPSLGTMAAQNSNNVTITGGSISGVPIDGGTF